ncbi:branched-chain amino acid ABC transporter permease [Halobellus sp. Atlit-31R]|nr:branched-chain amino acid ABC transporter permease [Halobellus sp. Atlit-31R]
MRRGVRDVAPILVGIVPFGLVAGAAAIDAGLTPLQAVGLSVVVFAGASQLAAIDLLGSNAELLVVVVTGLVINLRMLMYSASIAPHFRPLRIWWKSLCSYVLTDQAYALSIARYTDVDLDPAERRQYYFGAAASLWIVWQCCTIIGIVVGARIPDSWGLDFAVPLVFLSLLVPAVSTQPKLVAAAVGGGVAVAGEVLAVPFNLGLVAGGLAGVVAGVIADERLVTAAFDDADEGGSH